MILPTAFTPASIYPKRAAFSLTGVPPTSSEQATKRDQGIYILRFPASLWCALFSSSFGAGPPARNPMLLTTTSAAPFLYKGSSLPLLGLVSHKADMESSVPDRQLLNIAQEKLGVCRGPAVFFRWESIMRGHVIPYLSALLKNSRQCSWIPSIVPEIENWIQHEFTKLSSYGHLRSAPRCLDILFTVYVAYSHS